MEYFSMSSCLAGLRRRGSDRNEGSRTALCTTGKVIRGFVTRTSLKWHDQHSLILRYKQLTQVLQLIISELHKRYHLTPMMLEFISSSALQGGCRVSNLILAGKWYKFDVIGLLTSWDSDLLLVSSHLLHPSAALVAR